MTAIAGPPPAAPERAMLSAWLAYERATLAGRCDGLSGAQLRAQPLPPSAMSLLGLMRHLADVERTWFQRSLSGRTIQPLYVATEGGPSVAFSDVGTADIDEAFAVWRAECRLAGWAEAATPSLDALAGPPGLGSTLGGRPVSLRWIMLRMISEYARHTGHADLIRERIAC